MSKFNFIEYLKKNARTEEDVKFAYVKEFNIPFSTRYKNDCRTDNVLFEFKYNKNLQDEKKFAEVLAQSLYYVYRAKYGLVEDRVPAYTILADINESIVIKTETLKNIYTDPLFDWDRTPSSPDPEIVNTIINKKIFKDLHLYKIQEESEYKAYKEALSSILSSDEIVDSKIVSDENFEEVFIHWEEVIGKVVKKKEKAVYFIKDLQVGTFYDNNKGMIIFRFDNKIEEYPIPQKDYDYFWKIYKRPPTAKAMEAIISKADRLNNMTKRRFTGQFYTPLPFAKLGLEYIEKELGENYYKDYKIWDMACGTGNLEYYIPEYNNVYMSTLDKDEVEHLKNNNLFPGATIFQYDYLNDDVELVFSGADLLDDTLGWKMPRSLREDLANKDNKWLIYINPPFASHTTGKTSKKDNFKREVSFTSLRKEMIKNNLKASSRDISTQFIYRIHNEFEQYFLGTFNTLKYITDESSEKFQKSFTSEFKNGFIFPSIVFKGNKGRWPVSFFLWKKETRSIINKKLIVDIFNEKIEKIGIKRFQIINKATTLKNSIKKEKRNISVPCFSSAITNKKDRMKKITENSLGVVADHSTYFLSTAPNDCSLFSITKTNFVDNIYNLLLSHLITKSWLNNRDIPQVPKSIPSKEFNDDGLVFLLFHGSNQTSSIKDVECQGNLYQIRNQFFPYTIKDIQSFEIENTNLYSQLRTAKDTYVANLLTTLTLSKEAKKVLDEGKKLYAMYFKEYNNLDRNKFKLDYWDVGWYQVRMSLKEKFGKEIFKDITTAHKALADKLRPQIYEYGFLDKEMIYDEEK